MAQLRRLNLRHLFQTLFLATGLAAIIAMPLNTHAKDSKESNAAAHRQINTTDRNIMAANRKTDDIALKVLTEDNNEVKALEAKSLRAGLSRHETKKLDALKKRIQMVADILTDKNTQSSSAGEKAPAPNTQKQSN